MKLFLVLKVGDICLVADNKGKPLKLTTVYKIIQNERYTGSYTLNDEVVDNLYPQIIL